MATKKKRNKKHNPTKRAQDFFNAKFRVWTWEADRAKDGEQVAYSQKYMGGFWRDVGPNITSGVLARPQNWAVCIRALCWTGQGDPWIEEVSVICRNTKLQDLESVYLPYRAEVLNACQTRHVIDCGWLAQTFSKRDPADSDRWAMIKMGGVSAERQAVWQQVNTDQAERRQAA